MKKIIVAGAIVLFGGIIGVKAETIEYPAFQDANTMAYNLVHKDSCYRALSGAWLEGLPTNIASYPETTSLGFNFYGKPVLYSVIGTTTAQIVDFSCEVPKSGTCEQQQQIFDSLCFAPVPITPPAVATTTQVLAGSIQQLQNLASTTIATSTDSTSTVSTADEQTEIDSLKGILYSLMQQLITILETRINSSK